MRRWDLARYTLTSCAAAALLVGCGGSQGSIGAPGVMSQNRGIAPTRSTTLRHASGSSYQVVYNFAGGSDGAKPLAALINVNGTLYGTTARGGSKCNDSTSAGSGCGTVFSVTTSGQETVLHRFTGGSDGVYPRAALIDVNGTLYGTTEYGGPHKSICGGSCGTVFTITPSGSENILHFFAGPPDGAFPAAGLINVNGTLYGTTTEGGISGGCRLAGPKVGCGTVYSMSPSGSENVLCRLDGPITGSNPVASLIDVNGTMYGATELGGGRGQGSVYSVTASGSLTVLHHFTYSGGDGEAPAAALIDVKGLLYGTASSGSKSERGTVFSITTTGTVKLLHSFSHSGSDGSRPHASLINVHGTLYGTTVVGGGKICNQNEGCGTVFSITTGGTEQVLHSFGNSGDGYYPYASLINVNGTLYGTTSSGGTHGMGTIYAITP
jgi:uncharacterized repeat protein (TIGR03803 family)